MRAQRAQPHPACHQPIRRAPALAGKGSREKWGGRESSGNLQVSSGGSARSQPCSQPATNLVSRDSLVLLLNCVITLVRPLRGRQTGVLSLPVPV